jgi:hypothetical protein
MWSVLISVLTKLAMSLVAEDVLKKLVLWGMQRLVESTENTWDNELLEIAEAKWQSNKEDK